MYFWSLDYGIGLYYLLIKGTKLRNTEEGLWCEYGNDCQQ
jgi:hypothetical protein